MGFECCLTPRRFISTLRDLSHVALPGRPTMMGECQPGATLGVLPQGRQRKDSRRAIVRHHTRHTSRRILNDVRPTSTQPGIVRQRNRTCRHDPGGRVSVNNVNNCVTKNPAEYSPARRSIHPIRKNSLRAEKAPRESQIRLTNTRTTKQTTPFKRHRPKT